MTAIDFLVEKLKLESIDLSLWHQNLIDEANEKYKKNYKIINSKHILTEVIKAFIIGYIRMGGYKHGVPGVIYHIHHSIQRFLVWQKLWELQNRKNYELNRLESIAKRDSLINENNNK